MNDWVEGLNTDSGASKAKCAAHDADERVQRTQLHLCNSQVFTRTEDFVNKRETWRTVSLRKGLSPTILNYHLPDLHIVPRHAVPAAV